MASNIETDPFFTLLTDALRAGPGSPQWHDAIEALRKQGREGTDEHRLLIEARENLESGRDYRAVRAGPGFTRKLMGDIENEQAGKKSNGIPTTTIIAIVSGLLILGGAAFLIFHAFSHEPAGQQAIDDLHAKSQQFLNPVADVTVAKLNGSIPDGWTAIGQLKLDYTGAIQPGTETQNLGGGIYYQKTAMQPGQAFYVDVTVHVNAASPTTNIWLEAFVSAGDKFSDDKGISSSKDSKDLVWQLQGLQQRVLLSGNGQTLTANPAFQNGDTVRLIVDQNTAIVEVNSGGKTQRLWAGPHELGNVPRFVGVRFLQTGTQTGAAAKPDLSVQQIKIMTSSPG